jgi:hypothetical protein
MESTMGDVLVAIAELRGEVRSEMAGLRAGVAGLDTRVKHIEHDVVGNGKEGLKTKVDRLEQSQIAQRNQWLDLKKNAPLILVIVGAVFGGQAGVQAVMRGLGWVTVPETAVTNNEETPPPNGVKGRQGTEP